MCIPKNNKIIYPELNIVFPNRCQGSSIFIFSSIIFLGLNKRNEISYRGWKPLVHLYSKAQQQAVALQIIAKCSI